MLQKKIKKNLVFIIACFDFYNLNVRLDKKMDEVLAENLEKVLFTTSKPDEVLHLCVVAFDNKHAVSFRHGPHSSLEKGQKLMLHSVWKPDVEIEVCFPIIRTIC